MSGFPNVAAREGPAGRGLGDRDQPQQRPRRQRSDEQHGAAGEHRGSARRPTSAPRRSPPRASANATAIVNFDEHEREQPFGEPPDPVRGPLPHHRRRASTAGTRRQRRWRPRASRAPSTRAATRAAITSAPRNTANGASVSGWSRREHRAEPVRTHRGRPARPVSAHVVIQSVTREPDVDERDRRERQQQRERQRQERRAQQLRHVLRDDRLPTASRRNSAPAATASCDHPGVPCANQSPVRSGRVERSICALICGHQPGRSSGRPADDAAHDARRRRHRRRAETTSPTAPPTAPTTAPPGTTGSPPASHVADGR